MKELLQLMAKYNQEANTQLLNIIEEQTPDFLAQERGSYFGGLLGLLNHILVADLGWLTAYRDSSVHIPCLRTPVLDFEHPGRKGLLYNDLGLLKTHRAAVDDLFITMTESVSDEAFRGSITLTRSSGESHVFPFGKILMHLFNHQTHHRGAISQILDENELNNDYSNIMSLLMSR